MSDEIETTHLSDAELHDVVTAATAINEAEAMYLVSRLEDAGIPVISTKETVNYVNPNPRIRVPRTLLKRAQDIIETARAEARARALEDAFDVDEVDHKDVRKDPFLRKMIELSELPFDQKWQALIPHVIEWLGAGWSAANIARHLSVAGLTPDEARTLVAEVSDKHGERVAETRETNSSQAGFFIILGILCYAVGQISTHRSLASYFDNPNSIGLEGFLPIAGIVSFVYGLSRIVATKSPTRLESPTPKSSTSTEKTAK